jgi:hypothetical protein
MSSCTAAARAQASIRSRSGSAAKKPMLSAIEPANRLSSCITTPIIARQASAPSRSSGSPLTRIVPSVGCNSPASSFRSVVLPQPDGPAIASHSPGATRKLTSSSTQGSFAP